MRILLALALATAGAGWAQADVWDFGGETDNGSNSDNELAHGTIQIHDLGALPGPVADEDWFKMAQQPFSSYEVVVDGTSGDLGTGFTVDRVIYDGTVVQSSANYNNIGGTFTSYSRRLAWETGAIDPAALFCCAATAELVHIVGSCGTGCGPEDVYTIRFRETTATVPRFNNSATQISILLLQNTTNLPVGGTLYFWNAAGTQLGTAGFALNAHGGLVLNTATLPFAAGVGGTITVTNNTGYGAITGKAVAVEPATGFTFDTALVNKVY